jgi:hypothetical protein
VEVDSADLSVDADRTPRGGVFLGLAQNPRHVTSRRPHVGKGAEAQVATRTYVSCLARSGRERHRAAPATAPGSMRLRPGRVIRADGDLAHPRGGVFDIGVPWAGRETALRHVDGREGPGFGKKSSGVMLTGQ